MSRVTIIGGHGKVALLAAPLLVEAGHQVRAWIRKAGQGDQVAATGAIPVLADVEQLNEIEMTDLLRGTDVVIWSAGAGGGAPERTRAVDHDAAVRSINAAHAAQANRYVMVSYFGAGHDNVAEDNPFHTYAQAKADADAHLRASELEWTVLGPSGLTDEPGTGLIGVDDNAGQVSRANVAQVIAAVLNDNVTVGKTIDFNDGNTPIDDVLEL